MSGPFSDHFLSTVKVRVTKHAKDRVLQRFRIFMRPEEKASPELFIEREFRSSFREMKFSTSPAINHTIQLKHGAGAFRSKSSLLKLMGIYIPEEHKVIIKTVAALREFEK